MLLIHSLIDNVRDSLGNSSALLLGNILATLFGDGINDSVTLLLKDLGTLLLIDSLTFLPVDSLTYLFILGLKDSLTLVLIDSVALLFIDSGALLFIDDVALLVKFCDEVGGTLLLKEGVAGLDIDGLALLLLLGNTDLLGVLDTLLLAFRFVEAKGPSWLFGPHEFAFLSSMVVGLLMSGGWAVAGMVMAAVVLLAVVTGLGDELGLGIGGGLRVCLGEGGDHREDQEQGTDQERKLHI